MFIPTDEFLSRFNKFKNFIDGLCAIASESEYIYFDERSYDNITIVLGKANYCRTEFHPVEENIIKEMLVFISLNCVFINDEYQAEYTHYLYKFNDYTNVFIEIFNKDVMIFALDE